MGSKVSLDYKSVWISAINVIDNPNQSTKPQTSERYWIGGVACQDPSDRNRGAEFEVQDLAADQLAERLDRGLVYIRKAAEKIRLTNLQETLS